MTEDSAPATPSQTPERPAAAGGGWLKLAVPVVLLALAVAFWPGDEQEAPGDPLYRASVAVMPPVGRVVGPAGETDPDVFAEALANEISTLLARVPWLKVTPFYSVGAVQSQGLPVARLLDTLNVEHLLQGELTVEGGSIQIRIGHVDGADSNGDGLEFSVAVDDWLTEQTRIAAAVAEDFVLKFGEPGEVSFADLPTPGPGQLDFLTGTRLLGQRTPGGIREAIDYFWSAIEKDPDYARAYAQLSSAYALALTYRYDIGLDEYASAGLAEALATRAIELDPQGASGYASRSYVRTLAAAPTVNAAADIDRARRLEPQNPSVPSWSARVHSLQGDQEQALSEALRAAELDKLGSGRQFAVAYQALQMGRHQMVVDYSDEALRLEPELVLPRVTKARALILMDRPEDCLAMDLGPHEGTTALCHWVAGDRDRAASIVRRLEQGYGSPRSDDFTRITVAEDLAVYYGYTGDAEKALEWIERAYERSPTGIELRVLDSDLFDPVRNETGFQFTVNRIRGGLWERVVTSWQGPLSRPNSDD